MAPRESLGPANTTAHKTEDMIGEDTNASVDGQSEDPYDFNTSSPGPSEKGKENEAPANERGKMLRWLIVEDSLESQMVHHYLPVGLLMPV